MKISISEADGRGVLKSLDELAHVRMREALHKLDLTAEPVEKLDLLLAHALHRPHLRYLTAHSKVSSNWQFQRRSARVGRSTETTLN